MVDFCATCGLYVPVRADDIHVCLRCHAEDRGTVSRYRVKVLREFLVKLGIPLRFN